MQAKITVLMPVYNAEKTLKTAMDSILQQTYRNFEFLIIDDGSVDSSWDIIQRFDDERINAVRLEINKGLVWTLNFGLENINTEYIARMDADDISMPDRLTEQIAFMETNLECGVCGTSVVEFSDKVLGHFRYPGQHQQVVMHLALFERNLCHPSVLIRNSVLQKHQIKYKKEYESAEDYYMWVELAKVTKFHNLKNALLHYRRHNEQISIQSRSRQLDLSEKIVHKMLSDTFGSVLSKEAIDNIVRFLVLRDNFPDIPMLTQAYHDLIDSNLKLQCFEHNYMIKVLLFRYIGACVHYHAPFKEKLLVMLKIVRHDPVSLWPVIKPRVLLIMRGLKLLPG